MKNKENNLFESYYKNRLVLLKTFWKTIRHQELKKSRQLPLPNNKKRFFPYGSIHCILLLLLLF